MLKFAKIPPAEVKLSLKNKYLVLAIGLVAAAIASQPLFAFIYPPAVLSRLSHAWIFGTAFTGMAIFDACAYRHRSIYLTAVVVPYHVPWWCTLRVNRVAPAPQG